MRKIVVFLVAFCALQMNVIAQKNSAEIIAQIKGLKTVGSVLYFAAHPELTRKTFLESKTTENTNRVKLDKDLLQIMDSKFRKPKQLAYQGGAA